MMKLAEKKTKDLKSEGYYFCKSLGSVRIVGFGFKGDPPEPEKWKLHRSKKYWEPRSKFREEILGGLESDAFNKVANILAIQTFRADEHSGRFEIFTPGVEVLGDEVFVSVPFDSVPEKCVRISDMEWEQIQYIGDVNETTAKKNKSKKTTKTS